MKTTIPIAVRRKLERIERLQREVSKLAYECETLLGIEDVHDEENNWSFSMHINPLGKPYPTADAERLALRYMKQSARPNL